MPSDRGRIAALPGRVDDTNGCSGDFELRDGIEETGNEPRRPRLVYPFEAGPEPGTGEVVEVAPGVLWLRQPLGGPLVFINVWALADGDGWALVDTGIQTHESAQAWRKAFAGALGAKPITRMIVTHLHPDHIGLAGWITRKFGCRLWMTRLEYFQCRMLVADTGREAPEDGIRFYRAAGWDEEALETYKARFGGFGKMIYQLPDSYRRLEDGDEFEVGGRTWRVVTGNGHSPEHACLYCPELKLLISGDQVLPRISSNVSVFPTEPDADPLTDWMTSLAGRRIPIHIRPFEDPESPGTEVSEQVEPGRFPVKALTAAGGQALITVTGNGMLGVPGIAARTFAALHARRISVSLISQASSEHSICFSVPEPFAADARDSLVQEFQGEIGRREIDGVEVSPAMATVAVVGLGMHGTPGVAAGVFSALAAGNLNVVAIAQGSSELNIAVVVAASDAAEAQRRIHAAFQLSRIAGGSVIRPERMEVVLLGFGQIGRALASLLARVDRPALSLRVAGVIDRSGFVFDPARRRGLADLPKGQASTAEAAVAHIAGYALTRPVLVDLTADDTVPALEQALTHGMDLVLANKRPLADRRAVSDGLWQTARAHGRRVLHEATVGAGLPIIDTYHKLVESGDRVERIEGLLSGTLGYVLSEVSAGVPFSRAVRNAMAKGYTEPDPRDDLSGMDVARKALILARLLGYQGELRQSSVESLVPKWGRGLTLEDFLERLEEVDVPWRRQVDKAAARGAVLRYLAQVTPTKVAVGIQAVPLTSPLAGIKGSDNQLVFTTARYKANPLVITGPGAGAEVTAAGVLNDILRLAGG